MLYSNLQQYQGQIVKKDDEESPVKDKQKVSEEHEQPDEDSDEEGDVVPIVIRPGHIRFGRPSKGLSFSGPLSVSLSHYVSFVGLELIALYFSAISFYSSFSFKFLELQCQICAMLLQSI